jgi:hypothetical protein
MAGQFPIYRTEKTLPGQVGAVTGNVNFDTGAGQMARAIGMIGGALAQAGEQMWEAQARVQFTEERLDTTRETNKLLAQIEVTDDPQAITELIDNFSEYAQNKDIPNGLAARQYKEWLNLAMPEIEAKVAAIKRQNIIDRDRATMFELQAEAINSGNISAFDTHTQGMARNNRLSEEGRVKLLAETRHKAERRHYEQMAMNNPEAFLKLLQGDKIKGAEFLTPGDTVDLRQRAIAQIGYNEQAEQEALDGIYNDVFGKAANKNISVEQFQADLLNTQGLGEKQRTKLMQTFLAARAIWEDKGENPFVVTQDWQKVSDLVLKLQRGDRVSLKDIHDDFLSGPKGAPAFSLEYEQHLVNMLAARNKVTTGYTRTHPVSDAYFVEWAKLNNADKNGMVPRKNQEAWVKGFWEIEAILKENWGDPTACETLIQAIFQPVKKKQSKDWIRRLFETGMMVGMPIGGTALSRGLSQIQFGRKEEKVDTIAGRYIPTLNKLSDAAKLATGTLYRYKGTLYEKK